MTLQTPVNHDDRLVYTITEAGRFLGIGKNAAYAAARRGDLPTIRIGKLIFVPRDAFNRMLKAEAAA